MTAEIKPTAIWGSNLALEAPELPRWGDAVEVLGAKEGIVALPDEGVGFTASCSSSTWWS